MTEDGVDGADVHEPANGKGRAPRDHERTIQDDVGVTDVPDWLQANLDAMEDVNAGKVPTGVSELKGSGAAASDGSAALTVEKGQDAVAEYESLHVMGVSSLVDGTPVIEWGSWTPLSAEAKTEINDLGDSFEKSFYEDVEDRGLVFLVSNPFGTVPDIVQAGAQAELNRRHMASMKSSSNAAFWLASAVLLVVLIQIAVVIWDIATRSH